MLFPPVLRSLSLSLLVCCVLLAQPAASLFAAAEQASTIYLPLVITPSISVSPFQFTKSNTCSDDFSTPVLAPATFSYGIKQLEVSTTVDGVAGLVWRLEWTIDGQPEPRLDKTGTLDQPVQRVSMRIAYSANGTCNDPLPRGAWGVRLLLNGKIYQEATATIQ